MFHKALWMKEYRQGKWLLWLIPILGILFILLERLNQIETLRNILKFDSSWKSNISSYILSSNFTFPLIMMVMFLILACFYFGFERRNTAQDFTFSLPISRKDIFLVKWTLPLLFLTGTYILCSLIDFAVIRSSEFRGYIHINEWLFIIFINYLLLVAFYSLAVFIGTITGTAFIQALVFIAVFYLPLFSIELLRTFLVYIRGFVPNMGIYQATPIGLVTTNDGVVNTSFLLDQMQKVLDFFFLPYYAERNNIYWWVFIPVILIFFLSAMYCYTKNKVEKNGKIILFKGWEIFFRVGVTICTALVFAGLIDNFIHFQSFNTMRIFYFFWLAVGLIASHFLMKYLIRTRLKI